MGHAYPVTDEEEVVDSGVIHRVKDVGVKVDDNVEHVQREPADDKQSNDANQHPSDLEGTCGIMIK